MMRNFGFWILNFRFGEGFRRRLRSIQNPKSRIQNRAILALASFILLPSSFLHAAPTQEEVLRSIESQVGQKVDPNALLAFGLCVMAGIGVLIYINYARGKTVNPKPLNSPGKLIKEVAREMQIKPSELRQLRSLSERQKLVNPLVLILCPSLLTKAVRENPEVVDRGILTRLARKTVAK